MKTSSKTAGLAPGAELEAAADFQPGKFQPLLGFLGEGNVLCCSESTRRCRAHLKAITAQRPAEDSFRALGLTLHGGRQRPLAPTSGLSCS